MHLQAAPPEPRRPPLCRPFTPPRPSPRSPPPSPPAASQIAQAYCTSIVVGKDVISRLRWEGGGGGGGGGAATVGRAGYIWASWRAGQLNLNSECDQPAGVGLYRRCTDGASSGIAGGAGQSGGAGQAREARRGRYAEGGSPLGAAALPSCAAALHRCRRRRRRRRRLLLCAAVQTQSGWWTRWWCPSRGAPAPSSRYETAVTVAWRAPRHARPRNHSRLWLRL